jgi:hypothetical protein
MSLRSASLRTCLFVCLALGILGWAPASGAPPQRPDRDAAASAQGLPRVQIGDRRYWYGNLGRIGAYLIPTQSVKHVLRIVNLCRQARAYGFVATSGRAAGVVAWMPTNPLRCFGTMGGGPSGDPCLQGFRTPVYPRYWVFIAGTGRQICADLSTQYPGAFRARVHQALPGFPAGSVLGLACQVWTRQGLMDYVAPSSSSLPASKRAYWVNDYYVATGVNGMLEGVPTCWGVDF